ncbi:hypothetical protein [Rudaea sp.]|uniref:hypothetical protein n=1 Tax=Rudaea sp. TaxID=2136325 RepID=UPI002ED260C8
MHKIFLAALLAGLSNVALADVAYYVDLAATPSRITSFEIAKRGNDRFHPAPIRSWPFGESGNTVTVVMRVGDGDCRRDLRIGFADGRRVVYRDFDVCKLPAYRVGQDLLLAAQP